MSADLSGTTEPRDLGTDIRDLQPVGRHGRRLPARARHSEFRGRTRSWYGCASLKSH